MTVFKWDRTTPGNNATADSSINWSEGQAPSSVNDSGRAMMTAVAKWRDDISGTITTAGTSTAYTLSSRQVFDTLAHMDGAMVAFIPHTNCGATVTLNVDSLGAKPLRSSPGVELTANQILLGTPYAATYVNASGVWYLQNFYNTPIAAGSITGSLIATNTVTYSNIQQVTNARFLGNFSGGTANVSEYAVGQLLSVSGTTLGITTDTSSKCKVIGYDQTTGVPAATLPSGLLMHVREQQSNGVAGTSPMTGSVYSQRVLNTTITNEITGASLASNQVTLPAGTYYCSGFVAGSFNSSSNSTSSMRVKIFNVTGSANLILGTFEYRFGNISAGGNGCAIFNGRFTLGVSSVIEVRVFCVGMSGGTASSSGDAEVYTDFLIWRLA